jgi:signal transduction histidine kinase
VTRRSLLLVPAAVVVGTVLGREVSGGLAVGWALLVGVVTAAVLWVHQAAVVRRAARQINGWLRRRRHQPVSLRGGRPWEELAVAVNAVGAAYQRRGDKLRRERPWRRDLVDAVVGPALLFGADGRLLVANADARRLLGAGDDDERPTLLQATGTSALAQAAEEATAAGRRVAVDAIVAEREVRATLSVVGDELLVVLTDRTRQQRTEDLRRDFVVNASHELKTPATAIQALTDALDVVVGRDPAQVRVVAERLRVEADRLVRIVGDLLDLRRLEDTGELERVPVDLAALAREVADDLDATAAARGIALRLDLPPSARLAGVPGDLRLVVDNLVRNAVQYSEAGGEVRVTLRRAGDAYELEIADDGIGIPQHALPRIFERFYRVDEDRSRDRGGTGLGLSIVRHAVDRHGGRVRVESLLGEGTTFVVRLPVGRLA